MKWTTDPVTQVLAKLRDSAALQGVDFCRYAPPAAGTGALQQVLSGICRTLLDRRVCAVSAGAPQADTYTGCLHLRATLTYREDLEDGDGEYERTG